MIRPFVVFMGLAGSVGCASSGHLHTFSVGGQEILGSKFILCKSQVKWDGTNVNVDGLEVDPATGGAGIKSFKVGKLGMTPVEIHKIDNMALLINGWFVDKCNSAIHLAGSPELAPFLDMTSRQTLRMMKLLVQLETINVKSSDPKAAVELQDTATKAALAEVG